MANGLNYSSGNTLTFTTNSTKREVIDENGNHGFGVLSPTNLVDISGSTSTPLRVRGLASGSDGRILATNANGVVSYRSDVLVGGSISNNVVTLTDVDGDTSNLTVQAVTAVTYNSAWDSALAGTGTIGSSPIDLPFITSGSYSNGTITLSINGGLESDITITGIDGDDTFVTGATFSNGTATLTRNDGNTVAINGIWTSIPNTALVNDSVTVGTTEIDLGTSSTTLAGLTSVSSTAFSGNLTGNVTGNADSATALANARSFSISGDITASGINFDGTGNVALVASIDAGVVDTAELADSAVTTAKIADSNVTNAKLANSSLTINAPAGTDPVVSLGGTLNLTSSDSSVDITGNSGTGTIDITVGAGVDTFVTGGTFSTGTITFTNNANNTFTVGDIWTSIPNTALVNDSVTVGTTEIDLGTSSTTLAGLTSVTSTAFVGNLTGNVTGNADTASAWASARTIDLGTDLSGSVSIDGSGDVTLNASIVAGSVGTTELANSAVTTAKIADANVTNAKLANSTFTVSDGSNESPIALGETLTFNGSTGIDATESAGTVTIAIDNTVATLSGSQTLTNKTISGSDNTITNIGNGSLTNSAIILAGDSGVNQTISLGDTMNFVGGSGIDFVGTNTDTMTVSLDTATVQFKSEKGANNGYASLDANGKVPTSQLPSSVFEYKGSWNAAANSPTLADGTGDAGDAYRVATGGTQNLGSGSITFTVGDLVIYDGAVWQRVDGDDAVESVNGQTGVVVLDADDISDTGTTNKWDQTVVLTSGSGISATGTYPNFTIANTDLGSSQNIFKTIDLPTGTDPVAGSNSDTLTFSSSDSSVTINGTGSNTIDITVGASVNTNIFNTNGTLSGNRTVTQSGNSLAFSGGDFTVDGTVLSVDNSQSAVGIGVAAPDATAVLEVASTTKGFLFPRMTEAQRSAIGSPATGLMVYQTDGDEGVYINKSFGWVQVI